MKSIAGRESSQIDVFSRERRAIRLLHKVLLIYQLTDEEFAGWMAMPRRETDRTDDMDS